MKRLDSLLLKTLVRLKDEHEERVHRENEIEKQRNDDLIRCGHAAKSFIDGKLVSIVAEINEELSECTHVKLTCEQAEYSKEGAFCTVAIKVFHIDEQKGALFFHFESGEDIGWVHITSDEKFMIPSLSSPLKAKLSVKVPKAKKIPLKALKDETVCFHINHLIGEKVANIQYLGGQ